MKFTELVAESMKSIKREGGKQQMTAMTIEEVVPFFINLQENQAFSNTLISAVTLIIPHQLFHTYS